MVHALAEVWRVLRADGHLIDLRPIAAQWPVEVVTATEASLAGWLDTTPKIPGDRTSDRAISEVVERGWFKEESATTFPFAYYWQTVEEMQAYLKVNWADSAVLPDPVRIEARRLAHLAGRPVQIRIQQTIHLARYRKVAVAEVGPNDANTARVRAASGTASISSNATNAREK